MKKYYVVEMGCRGVIDSVEVVEVGNVRSLVKMKKDELKRRLKESEYSSSEIKGYCEEWVCYEKCKSGIDICLGEDFSFVCVDMESGLYKNWIEGVRVDWNVKRDDESVYELLNGFWGGE